MAIILVIDDDKIIREAVTDILEIFDVGVITASTGAEGIEIFKNRQNEIDGVIIDRRMPFLSGMETLQILRQIQKHVPVIISSGYADEAGESEENIEKPDAYLYKPYEIQDLINLVKKVILK
ncbi:MAG: response regulator [Anaerolineae bacterium]